MMALKKATRFDLATSQLIDPLIDPDVSSKTKLIRKYLPKRVA